MILAAAVFAPLRASVQVEFTDVTAPAGIKFIHNAGKPARSICPKHWVRAPRFSMPMATAGPMSCWSTARTGRRAAARTTAALYRNNHNGTFTDITAGSGLDVEMYGMGVAVADYDNDGKDDVYITALEGDRLFHNEGGGKFRDVTKRPASTTPTSEPAPPGSITITTASSICSSPTTCSGRRRATSGARSTARRNPTARRNRTKARRQQALSQSRRRQIRRRDDRRPASAIRPASRSA